jgi:hypothetical protein
MQEHIAVKLAWEGNRFGDPLVGPKPTFPAASLDLLAAK